MGVRVRACVCVSYNNLCSAIAKIHIYTSYTDFFIKLSVFLNSVCFSTLHCIALELGVSLQDVQ